MKFKKQLIIFFLLSCFLSINESNADVDIDAGNGYRDSGDLYKAKYHYQNALIKNKNNTEALYHLAQMAYEINDFKSATAYLNTLLEINNNHMEALVLRGTILIKQQQWDVALTDLELAEQQDTENATIQMLLESIFTTQGNKEMAAQHAKKHEQLMRLKYQDTLSKK